MPLEAVVIAAPASSKHTGLSIGAVLGAQAAHAWHACHWTQWHRPFNEQHQHGSGSLWHHVTASLAPWSRILSAVCGTLRAWVFAAKAAFCWSLLTSILCAGVYRHRCRRHSTGYGLLRPSLLHCQWACPQEAGDDCHGEHIDLETIDNALISAPDVTRSIADVITRRTSTGAGYALSCIQSTAALLAAVRRRRCHAVQLERQRMRDLKHAQLLKEREEGSKMEAMTISERLEHLKSASQHLTLSRTSCRLIGFAKGHAPCESWLGQQCAYP